MSPLETKDRYTVVIVEYAEELIEARWRGGHTINFYTKGKQFATSSHSGQVTDTETLEEFVLENLPYHLGLEE